MKAVIMAGGKGTRLTQITNDEIPKSMVRLNNKPILAYQIEILKNNGITDITIIGGYLFHVIKEYVGDGSKWNVNITYIEEERPLGTAGAFYYLKNRITEDFFLVFGDIIFDIDVKRFFRWHIKANASVTLLVHPNSHPHDSDLIQISQDGVVTGYQPKKSERTEYYPNLVNAGLYMIHPSILEYILEPKPFDLEQDLLFRHIISKNNLSAYRTPEYVKDVGTPERLAEVEADLANEIVHRKNLINRQKCIFLDRDGTLNRYAGLINNAGDIRLEKDVIEAVKLINHSEYLSIVITNQPVIARNLCTEQELLRIHSRLEGLLGDQGAYLDDICFCPHHPDKGYPEENPLFKIECGCRKPSTGLIKACVVKYNIDLEHSWMIGDTTTDIKTGENAGVKTILLKTGQQGKDKKYDVMPDRVCDSLLTAVKYILG